MHTRHLRHVRTALLKLTPGAASRASIITAKLIRLLVFLTEHRAYKKDYADRRRYAPFQNLAWPPRHRRCFHIGGENLPKKLSVMAVITVYIQSLLVFLIGLCNLVQGGPLLLPREPQSVTKPLRFQQSSADRIAQASSRRERQPFQGFGYLRVWTGRGPGFLAGLGIGFRPVGWLNKNGEWTFDIKERGIFEARVSMSTQHLSRILRQSSWPLLTQPSPMLVEPPYAAETTAVIRSEAGICFIWKKADRRFDCTKMRGSVRVTRKILLSHGSSWQTS